MRFARMTWLHSLGFKIVLAYVAGALLSVLLVGAVALAVARTQGDALSGMDVADTARDLVRQLRFDEQGVPVGLGRPERMHTLPGGERSLEWVFRSLKEEAAYRVLDADGRVVLSSAPDPAFWPADAAIRPKRGRFEFEHAGVLLRAATEAVQRDGRTWYLQFAVSRRFLHLMYKAFALPFTGAGVTLFSVVLLLVFGPCVYLTLRFALRPLRTVSESAARISPRSLHARLQTEGVPREIAPLVDSFNRALERLEQGYRIQQEFLATAAHELKTPLALVRAQVELGEPSAQRAQLLGDVEHMSRQIQQLLHLAEASEAQNYRPAMVDMHEVVHEAAGFLQRMADAAGVRLVLPRRSAAVLWTADRGAMFTLLKNLLENAIQHTPRGTLVSVELDGSTLSVRDWGPGVPLDQLGHIFRRFWRGPHRRDQGAGLGLAICQEIALAHGWALAAYRADPGLRAVLSQPVPGGAR